ncbi:MAG: 23S rRNA (adenine(2503)-C(2))-methyltransferase RlmN [Lewinellaceae bacterium]|nr:23S rRNA (adenine(2503)-C(2))-methyltransferase RlmN [Lewinellaceae bacterium]
MTDTIAKLDIRKCSLSDLEGVMETLGEKKFRARQVWEWLWKKGARSFDEMSNLSKALREQLDAQFLFQAIVEDKVQRSSDGTIKTRFRLHDGYLIESVLIPVPEENRFTVCVSCQVGCSLTCSFCATGQMKRVRNLDPAEIYDQVVLVNQQSLDNFGHPLTNIVYMGMGEPLLTYANVLESIDRITSPDGLGMSPRRITVSTAGIAKMIRKLADDEVRFNLALSLHAAEDGKRNQIMPINEQNNLASLVDSIDYFYQKTKNRISYEYIAFRNFNDTLRDAGKLALLCKRYPVRVNIIEYNPVEGTDFEKAEEDRIDSFAAHLRKEGVMVTVRRSRGKDIDAACGQLANKDL